MFWHSKGIFGFFRKKKKLGLALGGGNIKGLAHVGVLKVLERHNIPIDYISGNSAGSIAAAFYAAGLSAGRIEEIVMDLEWSKILRPKITKSGFFTSETLENFMLKNLPIKHFRETKIPLLITATDIASGKEYVFRQGQESIALAVRCSCNIPGVFNPVSYNDMLLIDGVFVNNLPADHLRKSGAERVIGVNLVPLHNVAGRPGVFFDLLNKANDLKEAILVRENYYPCDLIISPINEYISVAQRGRKFYEHLIALGEKEAEKHIAEIKRYV